MSKESSEKLEKAVDLSQPQEGTPYGLTLSSDLEINELIGRGANSFVYKARQKLLDREVAVKILPRSALTDSSALLRFQQEAKLTSRLHHANIVKVLSFDISESGDPFIVMEYADGAPLSTVMQNEPRTIGTFKEVFLPILSALDYAHNQKIVHRDIKPGNIIVCRADNGSITPRVVDFGIAKVFEDPNSSQVLTKTSTILGTPAYMSPEQCARKELDGRSDLYSLACVMYEYLSGQAPFIAGSEMELMSKHLNAAPPSVAQLSKGSAISKELSNAILSALEKDPAKRPQTAAEFSENLQRALRSSAPDDQSNLQSSSQRRLTMPAIIGAAIFCIALIAIPVLHNAYSKHSAKDSATKISAQLETTLNDELMEIKKLQSGSREEQLRALDKFMLVITRMESNGKTDRDQLVFAYVSAANLANDFAVRGKHPTLSSDELKQIATNYSNRGMELALSMRDPDRFRDNCLTGFQNLAQSKTGQDLIVTRVKQATKLFKNSNDTLDILSEAFTQLKKTSVTHTAKILQLAQDCAGEKPDERWSLRLTSMKAELAYITGEKTEALKLLKPVLEKFHDSLVLEPNLRLSMLEQVITPIMLAKQEQRKLIQFIQKEMKVNSNLYQSDSRDARMKDQLTLAYRSLGDPVKAIASQEESFKGFSKDPLDSTNTESRLQTLVAELAKLGPPYSSKLKMYRQQLKMLQTQNR